ncbi:MAG: hypothetical protein DRP42_00010 [Tenericutes bacterium]|nr:MAG: hypothetical protein DRP42_00010 [Mycoplasmatota bacterium]
MLNPTSTTHNKILVIDQKIHHTMQLRKTKNLKLVKMNLIESLMLYLFMLKTQHFMLNIELDT